MSRDIQSWAIGTVTRDIELRYGSSGIAIAKFSVACRESKKLPDGSYEDKDASFVDVTVFGQMAENAAESFGKGARVIVIGTWTQDRWEDKETGKPRNAFKFTADEVGPSVRWSTCTVVKNERSDRSANSGPPARAAAAPAADWSEEPF